MKNAGESIKQIITDYKAMVAHSPMESSIPAKAFIPAQQGARTKRGPNKFTPLDGEKPETTASSSEKTLHRLAEVLKARRRHMEGRILYEPNKAPPTEEWEERRKAVLSEVGVPPLELAYLYGYTSDRPVRELRIRHGRNEHDGYPLNKDEKPLTRRSR